jgi:hypothetical protein
VDVVVDPAGPQQPVAAGAGLALVFISVMVGSPRQQKRSAERSVELRFVDQAVLTIVESEFDTGSYFDHCQVRWM